MRTSVGLRRQSRGPLEHLHRPAGPGRAPNAPTPVVSVASRLYGSVREDPLEQRNDLRVLAPRRTARRLLESREEAATMSAGRGASFRTDGRRAGADVTEAGQLPPGLGIELRRRPRGGRRRDRVVAQRGRQRARHGPRRPRGRVVSPGSRHDVVRLEPARRGWTCAAPPRPSPEAASRTRETASWPRQAPPRPASRRRLPAASSASPVQHRVVDATDADRQRRSRRRRLPAPPSRAARASSTGRADCRAAIRRGRRVLPRGRRRR